MIGSRFDVETREIENRLEERDSSKGDVDAEVVARVDLVLDRLDSSDVSREHDDLLPDGVPHWAIGSVPPSTGATMERATSIG